MADDKTTRRQDDKTTMDEGGGFAGGCLCGVVRYVSAMAPAIVGQCHCDDCRKTSGTDHSTLLAVPEEALKLTGTLKYFDNPTDRGNVVSRGFCPECGASIVSRNSNMPGMVFVKASSLDDLEIAKPQMIVYASRAPSWRYLDPDLPTFAEMPPQMPKEMA